MATLSDLPDLVLLKILSLLPERERVRNARVCRRWKRLARDPGMWRHVDLPLQEVRPKVVRHVLRRYIGSSLQLLHLHGYRVSRTTLLDMFPKFFKALGKKCPRLQCLSIHMANLALVPMSSLPRTLRRLEMHSCDISHLWMQCKTDKGALPLLEHLVLDHVPTFRSHHLCLLRRLPALRSLVLCGTYSLAEEDLDRGLLELSQLQRIEVLGSRISTDSVLEAISRRLRNVCHIRVTVGTLTATGLEALEGLPTLESLSLLATWDTRELCMVPFATLLSSCLALPQLRVLELQGLCWEGHEAQSMLKKGLPHCRVIVGSDPPQTTDWWKFVSNPINSNKFPCGQLSSTIVGDRHQCYLRSVLWQHSVEVGWQFALPAPSWRTPFDPPQLSGASGAEPQFSLMSVPEPAPGRPGVHPDSQPASNAAPAEMHNSAVPLLGKDCQEDQEALPHMEHLVLNLVPSSRITKYGACTLSSLPGPIFSLARSWTRACWS